MVRIILECLMADDWKEVSKSVEIAKGKYKGQETFSEVKEQIKRKWQRKRKQ